MRKLKLIKREEPLTPVPTHWIVKTPEGDPPTGVLLLLMAYDAEDDRPIMDIGFFSNKLHQFITLEGNAIEEHFNVYAYHIVHDINGDPFDL